MRKGFLCFPFRGDAETMEETSRAIVLWLGSWSVAEDVLAHAGSATAARSRPCGGSVCRDQPPRQSCTEFPGGRDDFYRAANTSPN
jgi:hypothetical protein